jgi:hypothetical protein
MSTSIDDGFRDEEDFKFPVITISVSTDDLNEPIHVDLGSVPPFIASAVLEKVINVLKMAVPAPKITFRGNVLVEPFNPATIDFASFIDDILDDDDDKGDDWPPA